MNLEQQANRLAEMADEIDQMLCDMGQPGLDCDAQACTDLIVAGSRISTAAAILDSQIERDRLENSGDLMLEQERDNV